MSTILRLEKVNAFYGKHQVLHGIDVACASGSITVILGANGAGKTSLLRAISGLIRRTGTITLDGAPIHNRSTEAIAQARVGHVPDGRGTIDRLTVEENLGVGAYTRKDRDGVARDLERVFTYFPRLKERRLQQAGTLSGGEQQMLAIGRALMIQPQLLMLDEPSFGLAPVIVNEIFEIMQALNRKDGVSILLVEQNAMRSLSISSYAYVLETGTIVAQGESAALKKDDMVRRHYLGA